jgi:diguanylate cyclase (GGDEF)-like protein
VYCAFGLQQLSERWYIAVLVATVEAATVVRPFSIVREGSRAEFLAGGIDFVVASLLLTTRVGLIAMLCGFTLGHILRREVNLGHFQDTNSVVISAFVALSAAHLVSPNPGLSIISIASAVVAAALYETVDILLLTAFMVSAKTVTFGRFFWASLSSQAITWPWLDCLGILLGVIGWYAPWALPLMGAPLALVLMASSSRVEATEDRARLDGLLKATTEILAATTVETVTDAATSSVAALVEASQGRIDINEPLEGELGAPLVTDRFGTRYLIVAPRDALMRRYSDHDQRLLETVASITASALDKAVLHEDVQEQATRDALTGLTNRRAFEAELASNAIGRRSDDTSGVMFLDLDGFKQINDEHGHKAGDEVLIETAKRLLRSVRDSDTVARLGGDEFTVLLRGVHNNDEAIVIAERILAAMREPMRLSAGVDVQTTPSLGIALASDNHTDPNELLKSADAAMYEAKRAGKDCWRLRQDAASDVPTVSLSVEQS